ncbi:MAG: flagellar hook-length control protein FliK [Motiliproteus sp.]
MVDLLNSASRQPLPSDVASSIRRLEAMLTQGQPRTAQVVQVTPQAQASAQTAIAATTAPINTATGSPVPAANSGPLSPTAAIAGSASQAPASSASTTNASAASTPLLSSPLTPNSTAGTAVGTTAPSSTELFKIQVRLEGRLFELIAQKPLPPGSEVQISKDSNNRISLQLPPATPQGRQPAANAAPTTASTNPANNAAVAQRGSTPSNPQASGQQLTSGRAHNASGIQSSQNALSTSQAALSSGRSPAQSSSQASATSPQTTVQTTPQSNNQTTAQSSPTSSTTRHNTPNQGPLERIALQPTKADLPLRLGQRVNAEVISSRPVVASQTTAATSASPQRAATSATQNQASAAPPQTERQLLRLNVQGQKIELISPKPLPPGSELQLVRDNKGQLWAELPTAKTKAIEQVLREHLPQQQSPAPLLNLLNHSQASGQLQQAKPLLMNLISLLTGRSLTSPQQTSAESVKQQVQSSGTLMESNIARGDTQNLGQDHKALLLRLANQLSQPSTQSDLPKTLSEQIIQQTQQALSRVLVNQITSGLAGQAQDNSADTNTNRALALDIPVAWQDKTENLQLKIEREAASADETGEMQYRWKIRLNFEFSENRSLEAELTLEQNRVSVIWSGDSSIRRKVEQQLDQLQQRLEELGLEVQTLGVRDNLPGSDTHIKPPRNQLIDIKT